MENSQLTELTVSIQNDRLNGESPEGIRAYIQDEIIPVLSNHLLSKAKGGSASLSGSVSSDGTATVSGSVSFNW